MPANDFDSSPIVRALQNKPFEQSSSSEQCCPAIGHCVVVILKLHWNDWAKAHEISPMHSAAEMVCLDIGKDGAVPVREEVVNGS
jgi:hypothetical protein